MSGLFGSFWHVVAGDGNTDEHAQESNRAATPPRASHPPRRLASQEPPPPRDTASIDLTSARSPSPIYERDLLPTQMTPRLEPRPNDAKRRKLSDATPVPDPANGYSGPPAMGKPGAGNSFKPINTLKGTAIADRNNPSFGRKRATYSKHGRNTKSIGLQRHPGQQTYLDLHPSRRPATLHGQSLSAASPTKRRKTEPRNAEPVNTVEIEDSDEDETQRAVLPARQTPTPRQRSIVPSRSPHSTASKQSGTAVKPASQPTSEFANTDNFLNPRRAPSRRRKNANPIDETHRNFKVNVPFLGAGSLSWRQSVEVADNDVDHHRTATGSSLPSFEQGVISNSKSIEPQHPDGTVTSKHFPAMRINESTSEDYERVVREREARVGLSKNLRDYRSAETGATDLQGDPVESSGDELAAPLQSTLRQSLPEPVRRRSAAKQNDAASNFYRLNYVRTLDSVPDGRHLLLRHTDSPKSFRITGADLDGNVQTMHVLDLNSVNKVVADNAHRMRLTGPVNTQGRTYWFDLEFEDIREFKQFRENYVNLECIKSNQITRSPDYMTQIFKKPLEKNDKIGKSPMVNEDLLLDQTCNKRQPQLKKGVLNALLEKSSNINNPDASNHGGLRQSSAFIQAQTRPTRSTRTTAPVQDKQPLDDIKKVVKHSVEHGLGPEWDKPLEFKLNEGFLKRRPGIVHFQDLCRLDEEEMLNDDLINFDMLYLYNQFNVSTDRVYFFTTQFFESLTRNTKGREAINYDAVKNWTKRDDIFSYDYIVVPINENFHWYLAIICNVSHIARKSAIDDLELETSPAQPTIDTQRSQITDQENTTNGQHQTKTDNTVTATEELVVGPGVIDEDENLFEEEKKLSLIDRDDEGTEKEPQPIHQHNEQHQDYPQVEAFNSAAPTGQVENPPPSVPLKEERNPTKKKGKRWPVGSRRDPEKPVIMILDSLSQPHANASRALREWLQAEGLEKRGMTVEIDNKGFYPKSAQIPMQSNFSDCGLYVLGYADKFFRDPDGFKRKLLTAEMSAETDWQDMDPLKMRESLRKLIFSLYTEQLDARHKAKKAARTKVMTTLPAKTEARSASAAWLQPGNLEANTLTVAQSAPDETPPRATVTTKAATPPVVIQRPGSPIPVEARTDKGHPHASSNSKDNISHSPRTAISSPTASTKTTPTQIKEPPLQRPGSPEVRIPTKSPHIDTSSYIRYDGAIDQPYRLSSQSTNLTSPLQKHGLHSKDGKLRLPFAMKAEENLPSQRSRELPGLWSPPQERTRSGSHDDPIQFDDSQDFDVPIQQRQPRLEKKLSPEIIDLDCSQEAVVALSSHISVASTGSPTQRKTYRQNLPHEDSLQEGIEYEWQEGRDVARALKASLEDEQRRLGGQANSAAHMMQGVLEAQDMDVDDRIIEETPERQRRGQDSDADEMEWQSMPVSDGR